MCFLCLISKSNLRLRLFRLLKYTSNDAHKAHHVIIIITTQEKAAILQQQQKIELYVFMASR